MAKPEARTVVFVDMLGFKNLVETFDDLESLDGMLYNTEQTREGLREHLTWFQDPLAKQFVAFHNLLEMHLQHYQNADPLKSIAFSDSAFVSFRDDTTGFGFAMDIMRDLIRFGVPARMGIGTGTFRSLRFIADTGETVQRHSFQFFGTGVVRAYEAEKCGVKGLRILLHPATVVPGGMEHCVFDIDGQAEELPPGAAEVRELSYLDDRPGYIVRASPKYPSVNPEVIAGVETMAASSPQAVSHYYTRTLASLTRMKGRQEA